MVACLSEREEERELHKVQWSMKQLCHVSFSFQQLHILSLGFIILEKFLQVTTAVLLIFAFPKK